MNAKFGMYPLDKATPSLQRREPLLGGKPAPVGSLFVLGENGGYGATPRPTHRLVLGRNDDDVHVIVGDGDWYVSRKQAVMQCVPYGSGLTWTLRNLGRRPIRLPAAPLLLKEHEIVLEPGYTTLFIQGDRLHVVEVLVSGRSGAKLAPPDGETGDLGYPLTPQQRLVLVAMFQAYLRQDERAHPLSAKDAGEVLNTIPGQSGWTQRRVHHEVDRVRYQLAAAGHTGLTAQSAHPEALRLNLVEVLLNTATLVPPDLRLLDGGQAHEPPLG
ncbi:hypothetical protein [Actinophytocola sp.]|uniref:hypothetical protein n=1 Tax=Actinophytocola sp. TaxID=1872138 RepID=UPI002ED16D46